MQLIRTRTIWFWQGVRLNFFVISPPAGVVPAAGTPLLTSYFPQVSAVFPDFTQMNER